MSGAIMSQLLRKSSLSGEPEDIQPLVPIGSNKTSIYALPFIVTTIFIFSFHLHPVIANSLFPSGMFKKKERGFFSDPRVPNPPPPSALQTQFYP